MTTDDRARTAAIEGTSTPLGPTPAPSRTTLLVRVWVPDRPGVLGAVASRIGAVGGDVHELEVVDRGGGRAVDELVVTVPDSCPLDLLTREIDEIDGVDIEDVVPVPEVPPDPRMQAFAAALALAAAADRAGLATTLTEHAQAEMRAEHVAVVDHRRQQVVAQAGEVADPEWLVAFARGVADSSGAGPASGQAEELGWAVVPFTEWVLVTARPGIGLRNRERRILQALADLTGLLARSAP